MVLVVTGLMHKTPPARELELDTNLPIFIER